MVVATEKRKCTPRCYKKTKHTEEGPPNLWAPLGKISTPSCNARENSWLNRGERGDIFIIWCCWLYSTPWKTANRDKGVCYYLPADVCLCSFSTFFSDVAFDIVLESRIREGILKALLIWTMVFHRERCKNWNNTKLCGTYNIVRMELARWMGRKPISIWKESIYSAVQLMPIGFSFPRGGKHRPAICEKHIQKYPEAVWRV